MNRKPIPDKTRREVFMANRHLCCVCQKGHLQIHHINGDPYDNSPENLAVLCLEHHEMATAPKGVTARLKADTVRQYKRRHEDACRNRVHKLARGRTAFFMVDYKNVERIYQMYATLSSGDLANAISILEGELQEEETYRKDQGHAISMEPVARWNSKTQELMRYVKDGRVHPPCFRNSEGHEADPQLPIRMPDKAYHDIWVQLLVRILIICRSTVAIEDMTKLEDPKGVCASGRLVTLRGDLRGEYFRLDSYDTQRTVKTGLVLREGDATWRSVLNLKTHYVYSSTAAQQLSRGKAYGLVCFRQVERVKRRGDETVVDFTCTPLILGSGGGGPMEIP